MNKKKIIAMLAIMLVAVFLIAMIPVVAIALTKEDKVEELPAGKILEGSFSFKDNVDSVIIEEGYLYSTDEVLLVEVNVNDYGLIKLVFEKSEKPDARGAYRYDVLVSECEKLVLDSSGDPITVTAEVLVTTTEITSYKLYSETITTPNCWTKNY